MNAPESPLVDRGRTGGQERLPVGFPRYQVYLYNTSARTLDAHLYAYLGN